MHPETGQRIQEMYSKRFAAGVTAASLAALVLTGCARVPSSPQAFAARLGLEPLTVPGAPFQHRAWFKPGAGGRLHVYLEGDGRTQLADGRIAADPGPAGTLVLELLAQDDAPALLLGRPCHHGLAASAGCDARVWTTRRYSQTVVRSLAAALGAFRARHGDAGVVLIGHSGGGTLAMLLAPEVYGVRAVVTLAGNLDVGAWTALHGYSPLDGLDPARAAPLPAGIAQHHWAGADDREVPPALSAAAIARQPGACLIVLDDVGHTRGWAAVWKDLLGTLASAANDCGRHAIKSATMRAGRGQAAPVQPPSRE